MDYVLKSSLSLLFFLLLLPGCQKDNLLEHRTSIKSKPNTLDCSVLANGWTTTSPSLVLAEESSNNIPALYNPEFVSFQDLPIDWKGNELAIGLMHKNEVVLFPHRILDKHEVTQFDEDYWITLCPLAGTAIGIRSNDQLNVSGYLFNSNLMIGSESGSIYSQMLASGMYGAQSCQKLRTNRLIEASMTFWRNNFPEARILSSNTGFGKSYDQFPFSSTVHQDANLFFQVEAEDHSRQNYSYLHGIVYDKHKVKVYPQELFEDGPRILYDFIDKPVLIFGDIKSRFVTSYYLEDNQGVSRDFDLLRSKTEFLLKDKQSQSIWNIWGEAIDGPDAGAKLIPTQNHNGFWYAFYAMYQSDLEVFLEDDDE